MTAQLPLMDHDSTPDSHWKREDSGFDDCDFVPQLFAETNPTQFDFVFADPDAICSSSELLLNDIYRTPMENPYTFPINHHTPFQSLHHHHHHHLPADLSLHSQMANIANPHVHAAPNYHSFSEKQPIISQISQSAIYSFNNDCKGLISPALPSQRRRSAFVEWKASGIVLQPPTPKSRSQCLLKRCIRLLNDTRRHRILSAPILIANPHGCSTGDGTHLVPTSNKLAIHHVIAERKRRQQMNHIFSALRALLPPLNPKKGRVTVLLHTKEYLIHLKKRIEELQQRNRELEAALVTAKAAGRDQI